MRTPSSATPPSGGVPPSAPATGDCLSRCRCSAASGSPARSAPSGPTRSSAAAPATRGWRWPAPPRSSCCSPSRLRCCSRGVWPARWNASRSRPGASGTATSRCARRKGNVREVDAVADALDLTARRLDDLVTRERAFSADASHQLRTPLAALRLELETLQLQPGHPAELTRAVRQIDRLEATIDTLLAVARDTVRGGADCDLAAALGEAEDRWRGRLAAEGRRLAVRLPSGPVHARVGPGVVDEILDVLLDNATRHGQGTVTVTLGTVAPSWTRVEVTDEGPGFPVPAESAFARRADPAGGHGIGLSLARSLAHAEGGRLSITREGPAPSSRCSSPRPPDARRARAHPCPDPDAGGPCPPARDQARRTRVGGRAATRARGAPWPTSTTTSNRTCCPCSTKRSSSRTTSSSGTSTTKRPEQRRRPLTREEELFDAVYEEELRIRAPDAVLSGRPRRPGAPRAIGALVEGQQRRGRIVGPQVVVRKHSQRPGAGVLPVAPGSSGSSRSPSGSGAV